MVLSGFACCAAALDTVLRRRGNLANNGGGTALLLPEPEAVRPEQAPTTPAPPSGAPASEPSASGMQPPASPILALRSGAATLVQVSVQLRTGRFLLRSGNGSEATPELELLMQRVRPAGLLFVLPPAMAPTLKSGTLQGMPDISYLKD